MKRSTLRVGANRSGIISCGGETPHQFRIASWIRVSPRPATRPDSSPAATTATRSLTVTAHLPHDHACQSALALSARTDVEDRQRVRQSSYGDDRAERGASLSRRARRGEPFGSELLEKAE